jgi:hypothetical protein
VMTYYNDSVSIALVNLFPNIGLDKSKFRALCTFLSSSLFFSFFYFYFFFFFFCNTLISFFFFAAIWYEKGNRRKFFEKYAREHSFDPRVPKNWYKEPVERILNTKVCDIKDKKSEKRQKKKILNGNEMLIFIGSK